MYSNIQCPFQFAGSSQRMFFERLRKSIRQTESMKNIKSQTKVNDLHLLSDIPYKKR